MDNIQIEHFNLDIDTITTKKMIFLYNALEKGWKISKKGELYIFTKKHEGKKEVLLDDYLRRFIKRNLSEPFNK